ncbi:MAG: immunoglobulin domain-containing protein [bacterium]
MTLNSAPGKPKLVQAHERAPLFSLALIFVCVKTGLEMSGNLAEVIYFRRVGVENLPFLYAIEPLAMVFVLVAFGQVVERVNRHVYKVLGKVEKLLATQPVSATDTSKTWSKTEGGVTFAFTITLVGPNVYGWQLAAGPAGTTPLTVLMTGQIDRNGFTGAHEGKGTMAIDFAKLHAVLPAEKAASGTLDVRFDVSATARKIAARGTNVAWDLDPGKFGGVVPTGLAQPRSGAYLFFREPGKGGSLKIQDEMIFLCGMNPAAGVSALTPATAQVVSRWFRLADGTVHGRADGKISGGVLVAPVASIVGVTCFSATAEQLAPGTAAEPEAYWMMKAEGVAGATLVGLDAGTASSCDASFGAVPSKDGAATDFTLFTKPSFATNTNPLILVDRTYANFTNIFKNPPFVSFGTAGSRTSPTWADVEVSKTTNMVALRINNTLILQSTNTTGFNAGNIMLGYMDCYDSIGGANGAAYFDNVRVVKITPPVVTANPVGRAGLIGGTATLSVSASSSTGTLNYQWMLNGAAIAGATGSTLTLTNVQAANLGAYYVIVNDGRYPVSSAVAVLSQATAPTILVSRDPANVLLRFNTQVGPTYDVEYKQAVTDASWTLLQSVTGTGSQATVSDPISATTTRLYRVKVR